MDEIELSTVLRAHVEDAQIPGAAVAVLNDGEIHQATAGIADLASGDAVTPGTRFPIASVTKPMVATAIALLVEQGEMSLDDPIARHGPELQRAAWSEHVTIRQLLAQRSGVALRAAREFAFDDVEDDALARFCDSVAQDDPATAPGSAWSYYNTGYSLLGRAIETVTASPWLGAMRTLLFEPLEMSSTGARIGATNAVVGYEDGDGSPVAVPPWYSPGLGPGGAVLWSSVLDLIRFARSHVDGAGATPLAILREPTESPAIWPWMDEWCHGWARLAWPGGPVWGWDGVTRGARAQLRIVPSKKGAVALLSNSGRGRALYWSLMPILMREYFDVSQTQPAGTIEPEDLGGYEGTFAWPDVAFQVEARSDRLVVLQGDSSLDAFACGNRTFSIQHPSPDPLTVTFSAPDQDGRSSMLYWVVWGYPRQSA